MRRQIRRKADVAFAKLDAAGVSATVPWRQASVQEGKGSGESASRGELALFLDTQRRKLGRADCESTRLPEMRGWVWQKSTTCELMLTCSKGTPLSGEKDF